MGDDEQIKAAIARFKLPKDADYRAANFEIANLDANRFVDPVRQFHLDRLPRFDVEKFEGYQCAYCGKIKDVRSLQVDHILDFRMFCRYWMLKKGYRGNETAEALDVDCLRAYRDKTNLVLACVKCNGAKSDKKPDVKIEFRKGMTPETIYEPAMRGKLGPTLKSQMMQNYMHWKRISQLSTEDRNFVIHGIGDVDTREGDYSRAAKDKNPYGQRVEFKKPARTGPNLAIYKMITRAINTKFGRNGRPNITISRAILVTFQMSPSLVRNPKSLRLCLYCFGLFQKQAFQLDHIRPIGRKEGTSWPQTYYYKNRFNDPDNLIPVCGKCNAAKHEKTLSAVMLDGFYKARIDEGIVGINDLASGRLPMDEVRALRNKIFGI